MARKACVDGADFMSRERRALEEAAHLYETRRERHDPSYVFRAASGEKGGGPHSNTGQKGYPVCVDYLTVVMSRDRLQEAGYLNEPKFLLYLLFGLNPDEVSIGKHTSVRWHFYASSASILDSNSDLVGKVGWDGNNDSFCISLTGAACRYIHDWSKACRVLTSLDARITRCDVAYDDYDGILGTVRDHEARAREHLAPAGGCLLFASGGTPPRTRFLDDHGGGSGCTLYVGQKGHKQLCIYDKGKQLGVAESAWVRYEVRLYAKHAVIPFEVLLDPMRYLRGSYDYLHQLFLKVVPGVGERIPAVVKYVEVTGEALVRWLRRQVGPAIHVLREALGDLFPRFIGEHVSREGLPSRFRGVCKKAHLPAYLRETLSARVASVAV
ncbi:Replication initiation factor [Xylella taiwanensis]|uniref:Replication initiation factor domain-containing protein n=2 Tax=Xylella taiwanensis TaxID=1444770 RepID=A0ABS8TXW5_9GAMM|nr:replication initiation factor domain-containing protein [Xylella taiwanensis]AXI83455.1 Replication initiation factor [Xylella taiwanensis]AXI83598.1 Replication initiation factor [Xylella taiwanensis]MCD8456528.1 replication initiation factor domain-containing protein [Xylella taiwanensis]MCD8456681.1 replication initiation factor domain-containing protein [Xylella taiwanensis]MCD8458935.1 replication initiation factor domain-containing protein [Xylella taiwanensis]